MFKQNDHVIIHSIDKIGTTFDGKICGVAVNFGDDPATIYIVDTLGNLGGHTNYSHVTIPGACLMTANQ